MTLTVKINYKLITSPFNFVGVLIGSGVICRICGPLYRQCARRDVDTYHLGNGVSHNSSGDIMVIIITLNPVTVYSLVNQYRVTESFPWLRHFLFLVCMLMVVLNIVT